MVYKLPSMRDMARTPKDMISDGSGAIMGLGMLHDRYPCGLSISLTDAELEKLDLDGECEVGDMIHLFAFAKVTSVSKRDAAGGECCRIELQVTHIGLEDEDDENRDAEREMEPREFGAKPEKQPEPMADAKRDIKRKLYDAKEEEDEGEEPYRHEQEPGEPRMPPKAEKKSAFRSAKGPESKAEPEEDKSAKFEKLLKKIGAKVTPKRAMAYSHKGHEPGRSKHGPETVAAPQYNGHSEDDLESRNARR